MFKHAYRLLVTLLLVFIPAAILVTGNASWLPVAKLSVLVHGAMIAAGALLFVLDIRQARKFKGADFGEKAHNRLIKYANRDRQCGAFEYHFHAIRGAVSSILLIAIGMLPSAMIVALAVVAVYTVRGAVAAYYQQYGRPAQTAGRSRAA